MVDSKSLIWFVISILLSGCVGWLAFYNVAAFVEAADLLATIVSILTGVSLAVLAVLTAPFSVSKIVAKDASEAKRLETTVAVDDAILAVGQVAFFWVFFAALALLFAMKFYISILSLSPDMLSKHLGASIVSAITAFVSTFAFFWSARLPVILAKSSSQRRGLS